MNEKELIEFKEVIRGAEDALESYQRLLKDIWEGLHGIRNLTGIREGISDDEVVKTLYDREAQKVLNVHFTAIFNRITDLRIKLAKDYLYELNESVAGFEDLNEVL